LKRKFRYHLSIKTREETKQMNVKERIISLKLIGKKQEHTKFLEEIGVTAIMKENICNLENGAKESGVREECE
jgi:hypothetical protein